MDALQPGHLRAHVHGEALSPKGPKALAEKQGGDQLVVSPSPEAAIWGQGWDCERVPRAGTHPSAGNSSREARGPGMGSHLDLSLGMGIPPTPTPLNKKVTVAEEAGSGAWFRPKAARVRPVALAQLIGTFNRIPVDVSSG